MLYCVYVIWCDLILNSEWSVVALRRQNLRFFGCVLAQLCHSDIQQHQTEVEKKPYTEGKKSSNNNIGTREEIGMKTQTFQGISATVCMQAEVAK